MKYFVASSISENIHETPEGYLLCMAVPIARTGEMVYKESETPVTGDDKGLVKIWRDESEVFSPKTMASFEGKAITIRHPDDFVGPENWSELAKGIMQNVRRDKDDLVADLLITDKMAIGLVKNGLREVSCGYEADYDQTEDGKAKQKNIIGNHLALVQQGRAGHDYKIYDHKGDKTMTLKEKVKAQLAKVQDEIMKMVADEDPEGKVVSGDEKGDGYDELVKMVDEMSKKIDSMMGAKDDARGEVTKKSPVDEKEKGKEEKKDEEPEEKKEESKDEPAAMEERLKALEAAVEKLLENKAGDEKEEGEEEEESEDDDFEESTMTGDSDTLSRAEILAPGIEKSKDIKVKALKTCYGTKEGKKIIDTFTGGKAPAFDSAEKVNMLFVATSEVLKSSRTEELGKTKKHKEVMDTLGNGPMSAEKMNEVNAKFYASQKH
jgi:hypothetical protein